MDKMEQTKKSFIVKAMNFFSCLIRPDLKKQKLLYKITGKSKYIVIINEKYIQLENASNIFVKIKSE